MVINSRVFDKKWGFDGWLGFEYLEIKMVFRLWVFIVECVELILYYLIDEIVSVLKVFFMKRGIVVNYKNYKENIYGVWFIEFEGNYNY